MNFLLNTPLLHTKIHTARTSLLLLIACCCMVISNNALAQYPDNASYSLLTDQPSLSQYHTDIEATEMGGGTWGDILKMNVHIQGYGAIFTITSKKGPFYNTNSVSIRSMSHNGPVVVAGKIPSGSEAAKLHLDLDSITSFPHQFFATITNNVGYAWVGPVQISKTGTSAGTTVAPGETGTPSFRTDTPASSGPQRPVISETPERAVANTTVSIAVTAGKTQSNNMVRVQCTASSSDNTPDTPYRSGWMYGGETIEVPLTFLSAGTQAIFCNTLDSYGATSSLSQRTISVASRERFPSSHFSTTPAPSREIPTGPRSFPSPAPSRDLPDNSGYSAPSFTSSTPPAIPPSASVRRRVSSTPAPLIEVVEQGTVNAPMGIKVIAGHDPQNRDLVRIRCSADDSDRTAQELYQSDWLPPEGEEKAMFVFYSPGEKNIYCTSYSRQGVVSPSTRKSVNVRFANQAPRQPQINEYPYATSPGKATSISVTAGADPDNDQVKVQCSAADSNISENAPYTSEWIPPRTTVDVAFSFYASGDKDITCVTVDRKNEQSEKAVRKIHVHSPQYNPGPAPAYNFNTRSVPPRQEDCACTNQGNSSRPQQNTPQQQGITFHQPYIPEYQNQQTVFQRPEPQPDLKGRVVYQSNQSPVHNALVKILNAMSGRAYTATTDYNGEFKVNFAQGSFTGQIQATKGNSTSSIREVKIDTDNPTVMDLTIIDRGRPVQQSRPQWSPVQQAAPTPAPRHNSVWQFN
jgi:hypothetical protein